MKTNMTGLHNNPMKRYHNGRVSHLTPITRDCDKLQRHADSAHGGKVDPNCPACREIQERYGVAAK